MNARQMVHSPPARRTGRSSGVVGWEETALTTGHYDRERPNLGSIRPLQSSDVSLGQTELKSGCWGSAQSSASIELPLGT